MTEDTGSTRTAATPKPVQQLLHHVEFGSGTPVVLLHGYTIDHRLLLPLEPVFAARRGWRRLYVDLPGSGRSPRLAGPVTAEAMGEAVLRFVDKVIGDEPFAVVGISYGGQLARHLIAERGGQVLGTALIAPLVKPSGERLLPERQVLTRDEALLASLDPADREVFEGIALYQDDAGWSASAMAGRHSPAPRTVRPSLKEPSAGAGRPFTQPGSVKFPTIPTDLVENVDVVVALTHHGAMSRAQQPLVRRRHVDFRRVASAVCRRG